MSDREGTNEPGGADEVAAAHDALLAGADSLRGLAGPAGRRPHVAIANLPEEQSDAALPLADDPH